MQKVMILRRNNFIMNTNSIHIPAQSGNNRMLERMRRNYTREAYLKLIDNIRHIIPEISFSSDFICGFCGETEAEFEDTISLMEYVMYDQVLLKLILNHHLRIRHFCFHIL